MYQMYNNQDWKKLSRESLQQLIVEKKEEITEKENEISEIKEYINKMDNEYKNIKKDILKKLWNREYYTIKNSYNYYDDTIWIKFVLSSYIRLLKNAFIYTQLSKDAGEDNLYVFLIRECKKKYKCDRVFIEIFDFIEKRYKNEQTIFKVFNDIEKQSDFQNYVVSIGIHKNNLKTFQKLLVNI